MAGYYHLSVSIISRGAGSSAVASAAYRSGTSLADDRYGKNHDYQPRRGIQQTGIEAPEEAPDWMRNRERLWNAVEATEKRKDAQLAREFVLAFPHQLDAQERKALLLEFIREEFISRGYVADWAIHAPNRKGSDLNWHAHVMCPIRALEGQDFAPLKDRSMNTPDQLKQWRASWATAQNRALERKGVRDEAGNPVRVDHRSYQERGVDLEPSVHLGVHAVAMERRGIATDRGDLNRSISTENERRRRLVAVEQAILREFAETRVARNYRPSNRNRTGELEWPAITRSYRQTEP